MKNPLQTVSTPEAAMLGLRAEIWPDPRCESPLEAELQPELALFRDDAPNPSETYRSEADIVAARASGAVVYAVGRNHDHYVLDERRPVGYLVYPQDLIPEVGDGSGSDATLRADAEGCLQDYSLWAQGFCHRVRVVDSSGHTVSACGGFIGIDRAETEAHALLREAAYRVRATLRVYEAEAEDGVRFSVRATTLENALRVAGPGLRALAQV